MENHARGFFMQKRKPLRLKQYDYSELGYYFVTACTKNRQHVFGNTANGTVELNECGQIVLNCWNEIQKHFQGVKLDQFIIMPNHIHGIISLVGAQFIAPVAGPNCGHDTANNNQGVMNHAPTLGNIVRFLKARSSRLIRVKTNLPFAWQRNYYERVIRNERELHEIRQYILDNPAGWDTDPENMACRL